MATTIPTTSTPALSSPGLGSGLDVNAIVTKLMAIEQQPLTDLNDKETSNQTKISAYGSLKSALSTLQSSLASLTSVSGFQSFAASVSDPSILSASLGSSATAGSYSVEVAKLAQAHKLASVGFASTTDIIGTGTLTFDFGTAAGGVFTSNGSGAKSVAIAPGTDSLTGIRDAVNAANIGVTATIVNDGSANGNRLVFTSQASGAANSLKISVTDGDGNSTDGSGLSQLAYDPAAAIGAGRNLTEQVVAQNAQFTVDGIAISKASNTVADAIQGVTLTLAKTNVGNPLTINVASSPDGITKSLTSFVQAYNNLDTTFDNLTKYDATNKQASVLTGDATVRTIQAQLRTLLGSALPNGTYTTLSQIGLSFQADGTLKLDSAKLATALSMHPDGVAQLFAAVGSATDSLVSVAGFGSKTQAGVYAVDVTQLATRGLLAGSAAAGLSITAGVNDTLSINVDGVSATITLQPSTYADANALALDVQAQINGAAALVAAGSGVTLSVAGGVLSATSNRYGSASVVSVSGTAASTLFGAAPTATLGLDVQGSIGGIAALGSGQTLLGATGSAVEGLRVNVTGGTAGARGTVTYGRGFAARLNDILSADVGTNGAIDTRTSGLTTQNNDIEQQKDALNRRLALIEANYRSQFNALDTLMSSLTAQSTALTQELDAIQANSFAISKSNSK